MSKIIVITSGKGGVGKTTTAINLGAAMNHFGKDVLIVDANITTPNLGVHLNSPEVPVTLNHVLSKKADLEEAIYEHHSGIKVMPSSLSMSEAKKTKPEKLKEFKKHFKNLSHDYIIIDSAAGLGSEALSAMEMADDLIIVTNPEMPAITDALKAIKAAEELKKNIKGIIITRVRKDKIEMHPDSVKDMLEIPILGMVPEDDFVKMSLNEKDAVTNSFPKSKPSRAYKEIAAQILDVDYDSDKDRESFWKRIFRKR